MGKIICGVYVIRNLITQQVYVGSSIDIKRRIKKHRVSLKKGSHGNPHFQKDWILFGPDKFDFSVQELCEHLLLEERESFWIKEYGSLDPEKGYNYSIPDNSRVPRKKEPRASKTPVKYVCLKGEEKIFLTANELFEKIGARKHGISSATSYWRGKLKALKTYHGWMIIHPSDYNEHFDYLGYDKLRDGRLPVIPRPAKEKMVAPVRVDTRVPLFLQNVKTEDSFICPSVSEAISKHGMIAVKIRKCINAPFGKYSHHGFYIKRLPPP